VVGVEADQFQQLDDPVLELGARFGSLWIVSASPMIAPTVMRGLSDA
jgi:hypothetical protein